MLRPLLLAVLVALALPVRAQDERPKNVVLMIADGFGPASATLARTVAGRPLALDAILAGSVGTASTDSEVTDSASGATAYSCGLKTYNGAIGIDAGRHPCRTLLEAAEARGMATGLVATSRLTHATPAAFVAHVVGRDEEVEIAAQMVASGADVLFGGGRRFFTPEAAGGRRPDGRDLLAELEGRGYAVATDRAGYDALDAVPAAALLAPDHLAYELDRDSLPRTGGETDEPSLAEMTRKALDLLSESAAGRDEGFFLMVEGSRVDHAAHGHDPAAHYRDVLAYDDAVAAVLDFARRDGRTLVVSVADHETGGLTLGRDGVYAWDPGFLRGVTASVERMAARIAEGEDAAAVAREGLGVDDLLPAETAALRAAAEGQPGTDLGRVLADLVSRRAGVGWTTSGHTAVDVLLYRFGPGSERLAGRVENDAVGRALFELMEAEPFVESRALPLPPGGE
ncbi:MAG TPA: alkaline phosphatase [Rubricoccaceae bacterium]|nr:alkaline phosphatase [Rubricoccaceae bacterium]